MKPELKSAKKSTGSHYNILSKKSWQLTDNKGLGFRSENKKKNVYFVLSPEEFGYTGWAVDKIFSIFSKFSSEQIFWPDVLQCVSDV